MTTRLNGILWIGLGLSLLLAIFLSPFASTHPDGLEKVAEEKGFAEKAEGAERWKFSPFSEYSIPWIKNEKLSTAIAGLIGTLAIFFIALGVGKCLKSSTRKRLVLFLLLTPFYFPSSIEAFSIRPLSTDDAGTVERGTFQLEAGLDTSRQDTHDRDVTPSLTLSYGVLERMDLGIGSGYLFFHPKEGKRENGVSDTEVKLKYRWADEKGWRPALAITGTLTIPTASRSKGLGSGQADFKINTVATKSFNETLFFHLNLGYTFVGENRVENDLNYSFASQVFLTEKWALSGEIAAVNNLNGRKGDDPLTGLVGIAYRVTDTLVLDAGVEIGLNKAAPDYRISAGATFLFKP